MLLESLAKKIKREEGFTLVELLIVVAIIAILAAIAIPQFSKYRLRGYKSELESDAKNIYTAAQAYLIDNPSGTVDSLIKLKSGGYQKSPNVHIGANSMTISAGNVKLNHNALKASAINNNVTVFSNARITTISLP